MMQKLRIMALGLLSATLFVAVAFAVTEVTRPGVTLSLGPGDAYVQASEVRKTDNQSEWIDVVSGQTWTTEPYMGELTNPDIYLQTAMANNWYFVLVPNPSDCNATRGVYCYEQRYYVIIKQVSHMYMDAISPELYLQTRQTTRQAFTVAGATLGIGWIGLAAYYHKSRKPIEKKAGN